MERKPAFRSIQYIILQGVTGMNKNDELRIAVTMLPNYLLMKGLPKEVSIKNFNKAIKGLSKKESKQRWQFVKFFNDLTTTNIEDKIQFEDIKISEDIHHEFHSYQTMLIIFGVPKTSDLFAHAKLIDNYLSQDFQQTFIKDYKKYLVKNFQYLDDAVDEECDAEDFYMFLLLNYFAHLDAYIHFSIYSELINPISLGWLFMQKLDYTKFEYNKETNTYSIINKNGNIYTIPSRSFLQLIQCNIYLNQHLKMPNSFHGITNKIDWQHLDDIDGKIDDFIRRKSEGKWISLDDIYWLCEFKKQTFEESKPRLKKFQKSFVEYVKTDNIDELQGYEQSFESLIWYLYAFFQHIFEQNTKNDKNSFVTYPEYYDLWEIYNKFYENQIDNSIKNKRGDWMDDIKNQATRPCHMA